MDVGVGLDPTLNLSLKEQAEISREAAMLGYTSIWTPEGTGEDSFQTCLHRWEATRDVVESGLTTGIAVSPVMWRTPVAFAMSGGTMTRYTGDRFIMGLGAGGAYHPATRRSLGLPKLSSLSLMRDYLQTTRALLAGEYVEYEGETLTLKNTRLGIKPPPQTPVYLGALGPKMLRLAGEFADGASLNWCTPKQIKWSRECINEGAHRAGRNQSEIKMAEYIRVCVDEDVEIARRGLARATMQYALGGSIPTPTERNFGYRAHFERMGFAEELATLDEMRQKGASSDEIAEAFPVNILNAVGYYGKASEAAREFKRLSKGLDTAIVRVVAARPGRNSTLAVMNACSPGKLSSA